MLTANRIRPYTLPWKLFNQVQEEFQQELSDWFASSTQDPSVGVWTKDNSALVAVDLPGRELSDIEVSVHRNGLKIESSSIADEQVPEPGLEPGPLA